jgi:hypothetical protein
LAGLVHIIWPGEGLTHGPHSGPYSTRKSNRGRFEPGNQADELDHVEDSPGHLGVERAERWWQHPLEQTSVSAKDFETGEHRSPAGRLGDPGHLGLEPERPLGVVGPRRVPDRHGQFGEGV